MQFRNVLSCLSSFLKNIRVGRHETIFIFFLEGKNCRVGTKTGSIGLAETQIFLGLNNEAALLY